MELRWRSALQKALNFQTKQNPGDELEDIIEQLRKFPEVNPGHPLDYIKCAWRLSFKWTFSSLGTSSVNDCKWGIQQATWKIAGGYGCIPKSSQHDFLIFLSRWFPKSSQSLVHSTLHHIMVKGVVWSRTLKIPWLIYMCSSQIALLWEHSHDKRPISGWLPY